VLNLALAVLKNNFKTPDDDAEDKAEDEEREKVTLSFHFDDLHCTAAASNLCHVSSLLVISGG
jgi:hypothetical protein